LGWGRNKQGIEDRVAKMTCARAHDDEERARINALMPRPDPLLFKGRGSQEPQQGKGA
jgi:hypothetical protein